MILFEGFTESLEEVSDIIKDVGVEPTEELTKYVFKCIRRMEEFISHSIANVYEMIHISELANFIKYVIKKKGDVPKPEYEYEAQLFPSNYDYEEFNYSEGFGDYNLSS